MSKPILYAPNGAVAAELRKLYPGYEVVITPAKYPTGGVL